MFDTPECTLVNDILACKKKSVILADIERSYYNVFGILADQIYNWVQHNFNNKIQVHLINPYYLDNFGNSREILYTMCLH